MEDYLLKQLKQYDCFMNLTFVGIGLMTIGVSGVFVYYKHYQNILKFLATTERGETDA